MTVAPKPELRVLVIDDEKNIRSTLALCLEGVGAEVVQAADSESALRALGGLDFAIAFLDLRLGTASGIDLLPRLLEKQPGLDVVMVTAFGTVDHAVEAMKRGARDFLPKPFTPAQIRHVVQRLLERRALTSRVKVLEARLADQLELQRATRSPLMQQALALLLKAAEHDVPVLLLGENGTGKGVAAELLHQQSPRGRGPFVVVNCPTLSEELLASELFGHAQGAFTGAVRAQAGRVESADGGTLFLDEIGELPPSLQAKLLRFLQDKRFERLGESHTRIADVRVVAATNRAIEAEVKAGRFREDLYYRLNVVEVTLPPLRDRREDILPLAEHFLAGFAHAMRRRIPALTAEARLVLQDHRWPGNVRELRNTLERAMIFSAGEVLGVEALPSRIGGPGPTAPALGSAVTLEDVEREHIQRVIARTGSLEEAASVLGIDASTLYRKRKRYDGG